MQFRHQVIFIGIGLTLLSACDSELIAGQLTQLPNKKINTQASAQIPSNQFSPSVSPESVKPSAMPSPSSMPNSTSSSNASAVNSQENVSVGGNNCPGNDNDCSSDTTNITQVTNIIVPGSSTNASPGASPVPTATPSSNASANPQASVSPTSSPEPSPNATPTPASGSLGPITAASFSSSSSQHRILRDGAYVGLVAADNANNLYLYRSENSGQSFTPINLKARLSSSGGITTGKDPDGAWLIIWQEHNTSRLWLLRSTNQGLSWEAPVQIASSFSASWTDLPELVTKNGRCWLVFQALRQGLNEVYLTHFSQLLDFSDPVRVTTDTIQNNNPQIAVTEDSVHVSWVDGDTYKLMMSTSDNAGNSFGAPFQVDDNQNSIDFVYRLGSFENNVYLAYSRNVVYGNNSLNKDLFLARSTDDGQSFNQIPISDIVTGEQVYPTMEVDLEGKIYVFWQDGRNYSQGTLAYTSSSDHGETFKASKLFTLAGNAQFPRLATDPLDLEHLYLSTMFNNQANGVYDLRFFRLSP